MSTAAERAAQLDLVTRLKSSFPELPNAPTPDMLDHERITAYLKPVHDVGGEPDAPMKYENKQYELWEHMTYVICEVLGWRGIWLSEERRRMGNVDVGRAEYLGLPVLRSLAAGRRAHPGREAPHRPDGVERADGRGPGALRGRTRRQDSSRPNRSPKATDRKSNGTTMPRKPTARAIRSATPARPATPKFKVGDPVVVRELPVIFYTRTPEYVRGATGEIEAVAYESPAAEDETWDRPATTGMVLRRAVQHGRVVVRLHRNGRRRHLNRDSRTLARKPPNRLRGKEFA